ncbi:MAG: extracellular solute-binding protein, partial [Oscillospiraceae bacterium]
KLLSIVIAATIAMTLFASCGGASPTVVSSSSPKAASEKSEPVELKIHYHSDNTYTLVDKDGKLLPVFELAGEATNTKIVNAANPVAQNSMEQFQLQAAEQFPADIYAGKSIKNTLVGYAMQGAFIPLNDLIDEYAPNIKAYMEEHSDYKAAITSADGNIYMIQFRQAGTTGKTYFIREDWLKKLGYEMPKTFEDLETILYAFRDKDPNGNNKKDEIPYINERWRETVRLVNLWGARAYSSENYDDRTPVDQNGKVYHAWTTDEFRTGLEGLKKWYEDGIIDPQTFTRKVNTVKSLLWANEDVGGMTHEWMASTSVFNTNKDILARTPDFKVKAFLPVSIDGKPFEEHSRSIAQPDGWAISANCKDTVAAIKLMDWFFTEEGNRAANFGIEGESYTMVDGKPKFKQEVLDSGAVNIHLRKNYGAQLNFGYVSVYDYEKQWTNEAGIEANKLYEDADIWFNTWTPPLNFTMEELEAYNRVISPLNTYQDEKITAFITGKEDISTAWDAYVEQCQKLGAADLVKITQSAYDRYLASK